MMPPDSQAGLWQQGWYRFAHVQRSPNFGQRPDGTCVALIVVHSISLPPGQYGGNQVQQLFTNQLDWESDPWFAQIRGLEVSAHFYIRRNGELWQFVSCDNRAWHAGRSIYRGRSNCNDHSVGIELEGQEGERFEPEQYETLAGLCAAIAQQYPVSQIAGHEHIAPERKRDPGTGFDWQELQRSLGWPTGWFPSGVLKSGPP
jgi:AmpD protein